MASACIRRGLMSRKTIALVLCGYFIAAFAFATYLHSLELFPAWNSRGYGLVTGGAIALVLFPGIIPLIVWATWRFKAVDAKPILISWAVLGIIFGALSYSGKHIERAEEIADTSSMQVPGKDQEDFIAGMNSSCIQTQKKSAVNRDAGMTDQRIQAYCDCSSKGMADEISIDEVKGLLSRQIPASVNEKLLQVGKRCSGLIFKSK